MSSKRRQRRKACLGKHRYPTRTEATAAAHCGRFRGHWLRSYRCPHCTGWHIGRQHPECRMSTATTGAPGGTVYLLHFDRPYRHARHYCGWTADLPNRLADHGAGRGARLLAVITDAGIGWRLARTWAPATRARERQIKRQGGLSRCCPACGVTPRTPPRATATATGEDPI